MKPVGREKRETEMAGKWLKLRGYHRSQTSVHYRVEYETQEILPIDHQRNLT